MLLSRDFVLATAFLAGLLPLHAQSGGGERQVDAIARSIKAGNIAAVEVFGVPPNEEFRVNVNPERLESWWEYKLTLRDLESRAEELTTALRSATIQASGKKVDSLDVRSGIVFYSKTPEGKRIASLYFDRSGRHGAVNAISTSFGPDFFVRLKRALRFPLSSCP